MIYWHAERLCEHTEQLRAYDRPDGYERRDMPVAVATVLWTEPAVATIKGMLGRLGMSMAEQRAAREALRVQLRSMGAVRVEAERHGREIDLME